MIQHNLVQFVASERNPKIAEYSVVTHHIYCLIRYPKYFICFLKFFGLFINHVLSAP